MGERIYLMSQAERLEPLEEERFATEDELQEADRRAPRAARRRADPARRPHDDGCS